LTPTSTSLPAVPVLADLIPGRLARDAILISAASATIGLAAQVSVQLPFTPVPLTLQTLAVLVTGAALGPARGFGAAAVYLAAGVVGVPWFSGHASGWGGASFGYIIGFLLAAPVMGWLARHRADRQPIPTVGAMIAGNAVVYLVGVPWLMASAHLSLAGALDLGFVPFLAGDALKIAVAAGLLPTTWRVVGRWSGDAGH
jgi:biotin transport system substrate-specific component